MHKVNPPGSQSISIHVLRVEDDLASGCARPASKLFQSTSSVWRTTAESKSSQLRGIISIHVLRVEDDFSQVFPIFQNLIISIHVLRVEDDKTAYVQGEKVTDFNPRPPCGGRQQKQRKISICIHIIQQFVQICN